MPIPKLNTCCCCCTIETGSKILGYFEAICGFLSAILYILVLVGVIDIGTVDQHASKIAPPTGISGVIMSLISVLLVALAGTLLLMGVYKRNPSYVKVCLIFRCALVTFYFIAIIVNIVALISGHKSELGGTIIGALLEAYFAWVVYSLYLELKGGTVNTY